MDDNQKACLELLEEALRLAEEGHIYSMAIVLCMEDGWATNMAGTQAANLNLGLDDLKDKILTEVVNGNVKKPKSGILRVS